MKTQNKQRRASGRNFVRLAMLGGAVSFSALLMAEPKDTEKSGEDFAEQLREDLEKNAGAFADLIDRAMDNGGKLELDMEEFEKLMRSQGDGSGGMSPEMEEFLREMHGENGKSRVLTDEEAKKLLGQSWMEKLGRKSRQGAEEPGDDNAIKRFMEMFGRQMGGGKARANEREHDSILEDYRPVISEARKSTVALLSGRTQIALGTVVDSSGYVLTKASELEGARNLRCLLPGGVRVSADLLDTYESLDLALIRVGAEGLDAVDWAGDQPVEVGSFLAVPGMGEDPIAIGVASVAPRNLSEKSKGFLGVTPEGNAGEIRLARVIDGMPAQKAGLEVGDIVISVDGSAVKNRVEFHRLIGGRSPGDKLEFKVRRGDEEKLLTAKLVSREALVELSGGRRMTNPRIERMNAMGGELSDNREGFISALQTDLTLEPFECGGPVVNLDGKVVGINIARGGRVKSYAVPVDKLRPLLGDLSSGLFTITDVFELKGIAAEAARKLEQAEAVVEEARAAKEAADRALENATRKASAN